jgi:hypothetical protein
MALTRLEASQVESRWADALASRPTYAPTVTLEDQHGMIIERRQLRVRTSPENVYRAFTAIGGDHGWPYMNWAWVLRGRLDRLVGGVGFRRGRRHPTKLRAGDALDFWRVEAVEVNHLLRLRSEMRMPGPAWLEFTVSPDTGDCSCFRQNAYFAPKGFWGFAYWYLLYPIHSLIFSGMIQSLAAKADEHRPKG